jgi:hypothetical protein
MADPTGRIGRALGSAENKGRGMGVLGWMRLTRPTSSFPFFGAGGLLFGFLLGNASSPAISKRANE